MILNEFFLVLYFSLVLYIGLHTQPVQQSSLESVSFVWQEIHLNGVNGLLNLSADRKA